VLARVRTAKLVLDYELPLFIVGPTFPHEVAGFFRTIEELALRGPVACGATRASATWSVARVPQGCCWMRGENQLRWWGGCAGKLQIVQ
jgi:hypothetical protein